MTIRINNTLRDAMLACVPDGGNFMVYTGAQPASAGTAPTGTMLVSMDYVTFAAPVSGTKDLAAVVQGTAVASGTAGWARYTDGSTSVDGSVGATGSGADFIISSTAITFNDVVTLQTMPVSVPA